MGATEKPALASLVMAGEGQTEAVAITPFIDMAKDISNAYLVHTDDGDLMINTGFMDSTERNLAVLGPRRQGPLRRIILTQSHPDHFGGVDAFREEGTEVITEIRFPQNWADYWALMPHFGPRSRKLWASTIKRSATPILPPTVVPDTLVDGIYRFEQGGRRFELLSTPDGETTDALSVWMPDEKIVFTGNLFGPVFLAMPFLSTLRGDKPRSVRSYLKSLETVRALGAEMLITGHGDPIMGAARIRADLDKLHAAVSWVRDYTLKGMNAGRKLHELMHEIRFPDELKIGEFHGKASWAVKTIWIEYSGWFLYDSTTSLYGVPRSSVDSDIVALAGGVDNITHRAAERLAAGDVLQAIHLIEIVLGAEPGNRWALELKRDAHSLLLERSGGTNLSETMWLKSEVAGAEAEMSLLGDQPKV